jgi:flagellar biosynthesis/type III secretory pathway protein FliH
MSQINKFLFDTDFGEGADAPRRRRAERAELEEAAFSEDDLADARRSGYESGLAAGRAQASAAIETRIEGLLGTVAERLQALAGDLRARRLLTQDDITRLARTIAAKVSGRREEDGDLAVVARLVEQCLGEIYGPEQVTVAVDPALAEALGARLAGSGGGLALSVAGDPSLSGTECRIDWPGGGARRLESEAWARIDAILDRYAAEGGAPAPEPVTDDAEPPQPPPDDAPSGDDHG